MCGIAGLIQFQSDKSSLLPQQQLLKHLNLMSGALAHRGPDNQGTWVSACQKIAFAHRRLSIVDLSSSTHQPMVSHDNRYIITFNGEIYNYKELRQTLKNKGIIFYSDSDTEVLIECYREYGQQCLQHFDGMFAFVIYDQEKDEIFAARDPFGEKPFYYTWLNGAFVFASELSALACLSDFKKTTDIETVSRFLCLQYVEGEQTFYNHAKKLKPGHYLTLSNKNKLRIARYFEFSPLYNDSSYNENDLVDELESLLIKNIDRRLHADVPVGAFLSGGLDSSLVVAIAKQKLHADIQTFTIGFDGWADSEHKDANKLANYLKTRHTEQLLKPDCYQLFDQLIDKIDEPNADTSLLPTYLVSQLARQSVKVVLSGDGADELFGGYGRYFSTLLESEKPDFNAGKSYYSNKILTFTEVDLSLILNNLPPQTGHFLNELRDSVSHSPLNLINRLRKTDIEHYLPGAVLAKVDRMSMQHGLEVRTPFLSIEMARFAEKLPAELLANKHSGKLLLKKLAARYLPAKILNRPKKGFGVPHTLWGEDVLINKASKTLVKNSAHRQWWLNNEGIKAWIDYGTIHNSTEIYKLWSLYHIDRFIEGNKVSPSNKTNPIHLWLLAEKLQEKIVKSILFSILPAPLDNKQLDDHTIYKSTWIQQAGQLNYIQKNDWIMNFQQVFTDACNELSELPSQIIFLGVSSSELYKNTRFLSQKGIRNVLVFEDSMWNEVSIKSHHSLNQHMDKIYPSFFSIKEKILIKHSFRNLLSDFSYFLQSTFAPFLLAYTTDPFLKEGRRYLLDKESPFRAYALINEIFAAIRYYFTEQKFFKQLSKQLKKGFKQTKVIFILPSLYSGGAERQACNLMVALKKRGFDVRLLALSPLIGSSGHYLPLIEEAKIPVIDMSDNYSGITFETIKQTLPKSILYLLAHSSPVMQRQIWPVFYRLYCEKPNHVVCFLDTPNLIGGVAAALAGIPNILTSFRNINPTSFEFYEDWYLPYYKALISSPLLTMTGNSLNGNKSYANWLKIPVSQIKLLRNGVDFSRLNLPDITQLEHIKDSLGLSDRTFLIGGIFRLSEEKRPELFIDTFIQLRKKTNHIKAFIIGEGPLKSALEQMIQEKNLSDCFFLVGAVKDVTPYIALASIILQTSRTEGTANSLLEAQYLNKAVIATNGGGVAESLVHGKTGYVIDSTHAHTIAEKTMALLDDPEKLKQMSFYGRSFVEKNFSISSSVEQLLVYCNTSIDRTKKQ